MLVFLADMLKLTIRPNAESALVKRARDCLEVPGGGQHDAQPILTGLSRSNSEDHLHCLGVSLPMHGLERQDSVTEF